MFLHLLVCSNMLLRFQWTLSSRTLCLRHRLETSSFEESLTNTRLGYDISMGFLYAWQVSCRAWWSRFVASMTFVYQNVWTHFITRLCRSLLTATKRNERCKSSSHLIDGKQWFPHAIESRMTRSMLENLVVSFMTSLLDMSWNLQWKFIIT
jgi:hypothetical protein